MQDTFYVRPEVEAKKYGINVFVATTQLRDGESGMIEKDDNGNINIYVTPDESIERQRFTIAHELGHYVCGHLENNNYQMRDNNKQYSKDNFSIYEYEANNYAAELLMPRSKIDFLIVEKGMTTIEKLADMLVVSKSAMTIRLQNLGIISGN